jgi:hypothetical protein
MNIPPKSFETKEYALGFVDACPSELLHNSSTKYICIVFVYFFFIKRNQLQNIRQFKKTRGLKRRLQTQNYIIDCIENKLMAPMGFSNWNERIVALENGKYILEQSKIVSGEKEFSDLIKIEQENLSYGHCVSLGWYSIVLSVFLKEIGRIAKIESKSKVAILLDLFPGDNIYNQRSFNVIQEIINKSELIDFQFDAIQDNKLEIMGFAYGQKDGMTKGIKNEFEYTITDWIAQSFYSLLIYEKEKLDKSSDEFQLSLLARYLTNKGVFKIKNAFSIKKDN